MFFKCSKILEGNGEIGGFKVVAFDDGFGVAHLHGDGGDISGDGDAVTGVGMTLSVDGPAFRAVEMGIHECA